MSAARFRWTGRLAGLAPADREALVDRAREQTPAVRERVASILAAVRRDGDAALRSLALELDGVALAALEVPRERCREALRVLDPTLRSALERAARNIAAFHRAGLPLAFELETEPGVVVGRRPDPLARVGIYAPGGRAAYPSTVLMCAIPARAAGVESVVLCSPPGPGGAPDDIVLAAAELAGVDRVFALGGAGAIAAMAYGTASVPRVDRIVGPGNSYVMEAKLAVTSVCSIDSPAGPSELMVVADGDADADTVAREMIAQAEHDPETSVVAITLGAEAAERIAASIERGLPDEPRREVIAAALAARGALLVAEDQMQALEFAAAYAPEHLLLAVRDPAAALSRVRNAGTVFLGDSSSVAFGDYATGANHTLPTGGLARSYSGLSALDFVRWTTWQRVTPEAAARLADDVARLATAERLPAHARAAAAWSRR